MAADYASERRAAGRPVPDDVAVRPGARTGAGHEALRSAHPHDVAHHRRLRGDGRRPASPPSSSRRSGSGSRAPTSARSRTTSSSLLGWERFRASQFGIRHFCTMALNPKEANNPRVADGRARAPAALPREGRRRRGRRDRLRRHDAGRGEAASRRSSSSRARFDLPVLIHTPHRDKKRGTERTLALVREVGFPEERVLIDHNNEETLPLVLDDRLLGRPLDLSRHQDGRAAHGRAGEAVRHRAHHRSTAPPTGA